MANGKIVYYPDGETATTYAFGRNPKYPYGVGRLDLVSRKRALDGTAFSDKGPTKKTYHLEFAAAPAAQKEAFEAAYDSGYPVNFYLDADEAKTAEVEFDAPPEITRVEAPGEYWDISVEFTET